MAGAKPFVDSKIKQRPVLLFSKKYSPESKMVKEIMDGYKLTNKTYEVVEIENRQDCNQIEDYFQIICLTDRREVPQLFVRGKYIGGEQEIRRLHESGNLGKILISLKR
ncbi:glutaredoxin-C8-like [Mizuhopecten yessoensis]|uniref:Glutaredoxin-C8 n=1 Tax=Mizuhopecten yessoensis TaxID=6573 RepID=A0A210PLX4_MIZYE|nr:glutaredoxin-C8-like [Mizuhopecten yessoensis]OWF37483.1 Glutaredoxin-C8 [Mizuhopecten yessoensis]